MHAHALAVALPLSGAALRAARRWRSIMATRARHARALLRAARASRRRVRGARPGGQRTCGRAGRPWVSVAFSGEAWAAALQSAVLEDLRAGLRLKGIDACALGTEGSEPPLALLELPPAKAERVAVGIEVHDALTEKRVLRDSI